MYSKNEVLNTDRYPVSDACVDGEHDVCDKTVVGIATCRCRHHNPAEDPLYNWR